MVFTVVVVLYMWLDIVDLNFIEAFIESLNNIAFLQSMQEVPYSVSRLIKNEKVAVTFRTLQKKKTQKYLNY